MTRFFFDIHANGKITRDQTGTDLQSRSDARREAMITLSAIANDDVVEAGDQQAYSIFVRDSFGTAIYSGTLTYAGFWLDDADRSVLK